MVRIILTAGARSQLKKIYTYIKRYSVRTAEKVRSDIIGSIDGSAKDPEQHPADKYKSNNEGSFRAFEIYKYRVTYRFTNEEMIIIRIRHTKMNPSDY